MSTTKTYEDGIREATELAERYSAIWEKQAGSHQKAERLSQFQREMLFGAVVAGNIAKALRDPEFAANILREPGIVGERIDASEYGDLESFLASDPKHRALDLDAGIVPAAAEFSIRLMAPTRFRAMALRLSPNVALCLVARALRVRGENLFILSPGAAVPCMAFSAGVDRPSDCWGGPTFEAHEGDEIVLEGINLAGCPVHAAAKLYIKLA